MDCLLFIYLFNPVDFRPLDLLFYSTKVWFKIRKILIEFRGIWIEKYNQIIQ